MSKVPALVPSVHPGGNAGIVDHLYVPAGERTEPAGEHNFSQNRRGLLEASVPIDFFEFVRW